MNRSLPRVPNRTVPCESDYGNFSTVVTVSKNIQVIESPYHLSGVRHTAGEFSLYINIDTYLPGDRSLKRSS